MTSDVPEPKSEPAPRPEPMPRSASASRSESASRSRAEPRGEPGAGESAYWCELAFLPPGEVRKDVLVTVHGTRIAAVETDVEAESPRRPASATRLAGLTLPGFANAHSHAFQRALRGAEPHPGTFWTWREQMYELAGRLDPDDYFALARATYAEMAIAGITCVGEFHYLHHDPDGHAYAEPNVMGEALIAAAREAGLRIALLDACYLTGGVGEPLVGVQRRFGDGDADRWAYRVDALARSYTQDPDVMIGAAAHSVRAVPPGQLATVAAWTRQHSAAGGGALPPAPLHVHLSEQPLENDACLEAYGTTPTRVLLAEDVLGPRTTAVHATHLAPGDAELLGETGTAVAICPTTERDLADGIGPAMDLTRAGCTLVVGSDSQAIIDPFEELRGLEHGERLRTRERGHWSAVDLLRIGTENGHAVLGFADAGVIAPGALADLVSVRLDGVRTAGGAPADATVVYAASAADVHHVVAAGRVVVAEGQHTALGDVGVHLSSVLGRLLEGVRLEGGRLEGGRAEGGRAGGGRVEGARPEGRRPDGEPGSDWDIDPRTAPR